MYQIKDRCGDLVEYIIENSNNSTPQWNKGGLYIKELGSMQVCQSFKSSDTFIEQCFLCYMYYRVDCTSGIMVCPFLLHSLIIFFYFYFVYSSKW